MCQHSTSNNVSKQIPFGYCHCGCGQKTHISERNRTSHSHVKGQPFRFIPGHNRRVQPQPPHRPSRELFFSKVYETEYCHEWTGPYFKSSGYGRFGDRTQATGGELVAHRISYFFAHGPVPEGMKVLHKCDNRLCVNPDHLFLGTNQDNSNDMVAKGRQAKGERHGFHLHPERVSRGKNHYRHLHPEYSQGSKSNSAKLNEDQVAVIIELLDSKSNKEIAAEFHVCQGTIERIRNKSGWIHVWESLGK